MHFCQIEGNIVSSNQIFLIILISPIMQMKKQIIKPTKIVEKTVNISIEQSNTPVIPNPPNLPNLPNKPFRPVFRPQNIRPISYHGTGHRG